jgi:hypothetical protein
VEGCAEETVAGNRLPFLLAQRAASEGPRWTRAVKDKPVTRLSGYLPLWVEGESRRWKDWKGTHVGLSAPGTRAMRRNMRGQARWSPVLVQRAVSEDPRWTRAVGDHLARPQEKR